MSRTGKSKGTESRFADAAGSKCCRVAAYLEMYSMQEGSIHVMKFMEMKMTADFHF